MCRKKEQLHLFLQRNFVYKMKTGVEFSLVVTHVVLFARVIAFVLRTPGITNFQYFTVGSIFMPRKWTTAVDRPGLELV